MSDDTPSDQTLRDRLRGLRAQPSDPIEFDTDAAPADPLDLLVEWVEAAIAADVAQPHAMVLSTAAASGAPSARTLLLKDVTADGLWFATLSSSPKGRELAANPRVALTLYWREQGRQVRVTGVAETGPRAVSREDFLSRHPKARAAAIAGHQSDPIVDEASALAAATVRIEREPRYVPDDWNAWIVRPQTVEFWQAGPDREQVRVRYELVDGKWSSVLIWP